jgi:putative acetyltransferase
MMAQTPEKDLATKSLLALDIAYRYYRKNLLLAKRANLPLRSRKQMDVLRSEQLADYPVVFDIHCRAFGRDNEAKLVEALRKVAHPQISLVAVRAGQVVGHIFFSPVTIEGPTSSLQALGLAPMAVVPELQNQGIGSALVRAGLEAARRIDQKVVVVLGHPEYYPRFGFAIASRKGIRYEHPVPDEAFMVLELEPGALGGHAGVVKYLSEFSEV